MNCVFDALNSFYSSKPNPLFPQFNIFEPVLRPAIELILTFLEITEISARFQLNETYNILNAAPKTLSNQYIPNLTTITWFIAVKSV